MSEDNKICTKKYNKPTAFRFPRAIQDSWWLSVDHDNETDHITEFNRPGPVEEMMSDE